MIKQLTIIFGALGILMLSACSSENSGTDRGVGKTIPTGETDTISSESRVATDQPDNSEIKLPGPAENNVAFVPHEDLITEEIELELDGTGFAQTEEGLKELQKAMQTYQQKRYTEAIPIFENFLYKWPKAYDKNKVNFYLAMCYMGTNQTGDAETILKRLIDAKKFDWKNDARWYLTQVYIDTPPLREQAKPLLDELSSDAKYGAQAQELLKTF